MVAWFVSFGEIYSMTSDNDGNRGDRDINPRECNVL